MTEALGTKFDGFGLDEPDGAAAAAARGPSKGQRPRRSYTGEIMAMQGRSHTAEFEHQTTQETPLTGAALELERMPSKHAVVQQAALRLCKLGLTLEEISDVFSMSTEGMQELIASDSVAGG